MLAEVVEFDSDDTEGVFAIFLHFYCCRVCYFTYNLFASTFSAIDSYLTCNGKWCTIVDKDSIDGFAVGKMLSAGKQLRKEPTTE